MQTFETPEPISVMVELGVGDLRVTASERTDTVVDVRPSDPSKNGDVMAAEQTHVEFANGRLSITTPKGWRRWKPWAGGESIDVKVDVPFGSTLSGKVDVGAVRCTGHLGEMRFRNGVGDVRAEETGPVELKTGAGGIFVDLVDGAAEVTTGSGVIDVAHVSGWAAVKNGNGDSWIGEAIGEARVNAANGKISIGHAHAGVVAKTANGDVRIGEVERGAVVAQSAFGAVEVGVRDGVAAWLDLDTKFGTVTNELDSADRPGGSEDTVEIHARTSMGDITIRRSTRSGAGKEER